jgi:S1-C subfamily serine protease
MRLLVALMMLFPLSGVCKESTELYKISNIGTTLMKSTYLIKSTKGNSLGTVFLLGEPIIAGKPFVRPLLVTAHHVLDAIKEDTAQIYFRAQKNGEHVSQDAYIQIRDKGRPLWIKHPSADVAVMSINIPQNLKVDVVSTNLLATDDMLKKFDVRPGDQIYAVGFPFGVFSNVIGFPIMRSGIISSYPIVPTVTNREITVDFKIFPGNSGGPVFFLDKNRVFGDGNYHSQVISFVLGLVSQEKFFGEKSVSLTESSFKKHPLGLGLIVPAPFIRQTVMMYFERNKLELANLRAQVKNQDPNKKTN